MVLEQGTMMTIEAAVSVWRSSNRIFINDGVNSFVARMDNPNPIFPTPASTASPGPTVPPSVSVTKAKRVAKRYGAKPLEPVGQLSAIKKPHQDKAGGERDEGMMRSTGARHMLRQWGDCSIVKLYSKREVVGREQDSHISRIKICKN